jgi:hypothetical protein
MERGDNWKSVETVDIFLLPDGTEQHELPKGTSGTRSFVAAKSIFAKHETV